MIPREETRPDFEGELAVVHRPAHVPRRRREALPAIGGITALHDVSGRRAQLETPLRQFTLGKSFDTFTPIGPAHRVADGIDLTDVDVRTTISGEVMQDANTRDLIFPVDRARSMYLSQGMTLEPGDVIATGTPGGVGDSRDPRALPARGRRRRRSRSAASARCATACGWRPEPACAGQVAASRRSSACSRCRRASVSARGPSPASIASMIPSCSSASECMSAAVSTMRA